ncbi:MAG TPA: glycogen debranching protein GlgX [Mariprofundaceae bacterium]|nr:glycogen debranching protein GlgX [Mariprofundaceae bacterium]
MHGSMALMVETGSPLPLGARQCCGGVNFAVFSRYATGVSLLLFDAPQDEAPTHSIALDKRMNRTGDVWHVSVGGLDHPILYAWQADGPDAPERGHRFDKRKILLDPYAAALAGTDCWDFACACEDMTGKASDAGSKAKCLLPDTAFDWQGDCPPAHPWSETVIYETHVRGFSVHPSSAVEHPGTFLGIVDKIPYFQELGVTAIELLPVQEFYENELTRSNPLTGEVLCNYWGYSTVAFFAPKESYGSRSHVGCQVDEFKTMVKALHQAGIEIILDIVFNHTAEGNHLGPTLNFRGLDNSIYYLLEADQRYYKNYSGTGNTLNCNHPAVRDYILDCLRHWVIETHVDGFRFDLASVLGRDANGDLLANPPLLERIAEDPVLRHVKLIAEAWDAGGAYQVGSFPGMRWSEWNGRFRDDVRRFWRGDAGMTGVLASRLCGSSDIYQHSGKSPLHSINYVTCHDGFTLNDWVSYGQKHNEANGEENADGSNDNYNALRGEEGPADDPAVEAVRLRRIKNMLTTLLLSRGVPMLLGGDEFRRSQGGNNNAYCQDNETSWYDWDLLQQHAELHRFVRSLIALRLRFPVLCAERFYSAEEIQWFGPDLAEPDWSGSRGLLGCMIHTDRNAGEALCLLFNATNEAVDFRLPEPLSEQGWRILLDTAQPTPEEGDKGSSAWLPEMGRCAMQPSVLMVLCTGEQIEKEHA